MVKNITLKVLPSDDTIASLEVRDEKGKTLITSSLLSLNDSFDKFAQLQTNIREHIPQRREQMRGAITNKAATQNFLDAATNTYQKCEDSKKALIESLNQLLDDPKILISRKN